MKTKYTNAFAALHWVHAVLITLLLIGGTFNLPDLPELTKDLTKLGTQLAPFKNHIILGLLTSLLVLVRLLMLWKQPKLEPLKVNPMRQNLITWNHRLIYLFLILTGASGIATASSANVGDVTLWGSSPSYYSGPEGITDILASVHGASTTILMLLIAMHVAGTLAYTMTKENVLKRMGFGEK